MGNEKLILCLSAQEIAKEKTLQPYFNSLKQLISAPADIYDELCQSTLNRFCEFCQTMPFSMDNQEPFGLLKQQLNLAITALKLLRGKMLPINSDCEAIAEQQPSWTYAVFSSCLFTQIHKIQNDRTIVLYKNNNDQLGKWHPVAGSLYEPKTYYKIFAKPNAMMVPCLLQAALIGKLIPHVALRWLSNYPGVFSIWWNHIVSEEMPSSTLGDLIKTSAEKISYPLDTILFYKEKLKVLTADTIQNSVLKDNNYLLNELITWIIDQKQKAKSRVIENKAFRVLGGYLVSLKCIQNFLDQKMYKNNFVDFVEKINDFLVKDNDSALHYYRRIENRQRVQGVIIAEKHLYDTLRDEKIESDFIVDNS